MRISHFFAACSLVLAPSLVQAQPAAPPRPADAAEVPDTELQLGMQLIELLDVRGAAAAGIRLMMDAQVEAQPHLAPYRERMEAWANGIFSTPEAAQAYARLYAETFTEGELRDMIAFYQSPTGRRFTAEQSRLVAGGETIGRELAEAHLDELMELLEEETKAVPAPPQKRPN